MGSNNKRAEYIRHSVWLAYAFGIDYPMTRGVTIDGRAYEDLKEGEQDAQDNRAEQSEP